MAEFLLHGLALQELEVVNQQDVNRLELVLERNRVAASQRLNETVHEALGGEEQHLALWVNVADAVADGIEQMGFAKARGGMNEQGIEGDGCADICIGHTAGGRMGQLIGGSHHKTVKGLG